MTKTMQTLRALLYYIPVAVCFALLGVGMLAFTIVGLERLDAVTAFFVMAIAFGVFAVAMRPREV